MKEIQHRTKRTPGIIDIPNLVEIQLDSYKWFLREGLRELFHSFSPIHDFTGNLSLELVDYTLGDPKYSVEECRNRDMTYEAPIKVKVRLQAKEGEVIESEVYLGDLPLMTERGTFVINGAERVVVSQLARSSGVYFKDTLDFSGRVLYFATVIPNEGAWVDIESDANDVISVRVGQTKKFPLTTLLRALSAFSEACPVTEILPTRETQGRMLVEPIVDLETGEVLIDAGKTITDKLLAKLEGHKLPEKAAVAADSTPCDTTGEILELFSKKKKLKNPTRDQLRGRRLSHEIIDPKTQKVILKAYAKITEEAAKKVENLKLDEVEVLDTNRYVEATIDQDGANSKEEALIDIYHKVRPGDPATRDSAKSLLNSIFFDTRRYDLARVGRYKLNKKLGLNLPESVRTLTKEDLLKVIEYIIGLSESGALVTHLAVSRLHSRIPELEKAVKDAGKAATPEEKAEDGKISRLKESLEVLRNLRLGSILTEQKIKGIKELLDLVPNGRRLVAETPAELFPEETAVRLSPCDTDDIDHLENKRVRSVGELLQSQLRMGFLRMEKVAKERMTSLDPENVIPQVILSVKPVSASIKSFFGSSQLSQFMDQTNPLAELTHKRRLSALGPGGLSRQSAKLEVRDVHHSHYGRICPIETPEGPNIGLIGSMAVHAKIDDYGFIRSPYRVVKNGRVTNEIVFLPADEDDEEYIAPANTLIDEKTGKFLTDTVLVRHENVYPQVPSDKVTYVDIAPMQIMSVATAMIPFLENDDANRALMGSNMQRQAVPLLRADAPIVRTGVESRAARDSKAVIVAKHDGVVKSVTAEKILIETLDGQVDEYHMLNMLRSNQATCVTQKPIVKSGKRVRAGQVIADGPSTDGGELALGQNVLCTFMPWHGYNYEDAILLSERMVMDDVYTSIHIEKYETEARDTKLGPEEVTRDIPNIGEDMLKDLDENGIIRIGAEVRPEDILVGKVAPKGQGELTAEERLIIAIFGKKAEETRDVSLRVPHGETGKVVDVKVFSRFKYKCTRCATVYNFSKKPERTLCERCDGELSREPGDELPAGVNQLVRVYIAQKRKVMEGDKMAGRHGNKGVISKILPMEDMPYLPDGTPVDIVLNPLGVPSRMNIGQILETHLGLVGRELGVAFRNPIFQGAVEREILADLDIMAWKLKLKALKSYVISDLKLEIEFPEIDRLQSMLDQALKNVQEVFKQSDLDAIMTPFYDAWDSCIERIRAKVSEFDARDLEIMSARVGASAVVDDPVAVAESLVKDESEEETEEDAETEAKTEDEGPLPYAGEPAPADYDITGIIDHIIDNVMQRVGLEEVREENKDGSVKRHLSGKIQLHDGLTGLPFNQPSTVGYIYMLKLSHLVEDKIHARSTGPYSLVTQQPLGGKAQFGGQRFGEMEVWALEAYGAAYTLQEILTIKSDDVLGRVKTYESIVKGDSMLEPGVPESFKILVNELQSLGLKVTVEDDRERAIDLKDHEDEFGEGDGAGRITAKRKQKALELKEDF
ncbi:MAG: DNA-directed RNA polymerase subunit beta [Armatimonadota bacterium]